jgi:hypothetical protein
MRNFVSSMSHYSLSSNMKDAKWRSCLFRRKDVAKSMCYLLFFFIVVVETVERPERATTGLILSH